MASAQGQRPRVKGSVISDVRRAQPRSFRAAVDAAPMAYVDRLDLELSVLEEGVLGAVPLARKVLAFLQKIIEIETGKSSIELGLADMLHTLSPSGVAMKSFCDLYFRAKELSQPLASKEAVAVLSRNFPPTLVAKQLRAWFEWYRGVASGVREVAGEIKSDNGKKIEAQISQALSRSLGSVIYAKTDLTVEGLVNAPLWVRLFVVQNGKIVKARSDWASWANRQVVGDEYKGAANAFHCFIPDSNRCVVRGVPLILPIAALDLSDGNQEVLVKVQLENQSAHVLCATTERLQINTSVKQPQSPVPAAQDFLLWPSDPITLNHLHNFKSDCRGLEGQDGRFSCSFDLNVYSLEEQRVFIEAGLVNVRGARIPLKKINSSGACVTEFIKTIPITLEKLFTHFAGISFEIPEKSLEEALNKDETFWEIRVRDERGTTLCGMIRRI